MFVSCFVAFPGTFTSVGSFKSYTQHFEFVGIIPGSQIQKLSSERLTDFPHGYTTYRNRHSSNFLSIQTI